MATLSAPQLARDGRDAGFAGDGLVAFVAVCLAESGGRTDAVSPTGDVGIAQIHMAAHPDVSMACALDPACAARVAYRISAGGTDWTSWAVWTNGRYRLFLSQSQEAVRRVGDAPATAPPSAMSGGAARAAALLAVAAFAYAALS